ncbi:MAG: glucosidase [Myxococcota bacterium]
MSERQWGTVREDYSAHGDAWDYLPHDHARSRAYRWGEDGLAGISDNHQRLCFALGLWNGRDPILKERLFGLTNGEGNHGEDVKEQYYYLDATPSHAYLRMLYKYPQRAFPYARLVEENARRSRDEPEFELLDTGIFDDDAYFDVFVTYARAGVDDIAIRIRAYNRGAAPATLHLLPQIWFRNTWAWTDTSGDRPSARRHDPNTIALAHATLGTFHLWCDPRTAGRAEPGLVFCDNETNGPRIFGTAPDGRRFKDGLHDYIIDGRRAAIDLEQGTKGAFLHRVEVAAGGWAEVRLRLRAADLDGDPADGFDEIFAVREREADEFYAALQTGMADEDARRVHRQALAGMIWTKQFYHYDVHEWLEGDRAHPAPPRARRQGRNADWDHLYNDDIISMPDKWEYPWYAAWDLAFHCLPLALVDTTFAKEQLVLLTREWYMHPNGQLPAYEWAFGDVNPPVHAWATWRVFQIDRKQRGDRGDLAFLESVFHKMLLNFTWWVNRKDPQGNNVFQGGFLGLDNIGIFDRSQPLPTGGHLEQSDGTSWMAMFSLTMMRMALELALHNPTYEDIATKFFEHFLHIAKAMTNFGGDADGLWDPDDAFYYDVIRFPDGRRQPLKIRSMVGLIPLFAVETLEPELLERLPAFRRRMDWVFEHRPDLTRLVSRWHEPGRGERRLLSLLRGHRMKALLRRMLDPGEFLADHGVRAMSRHHHQHPYRLDWGGRRFEVKYTPAESDSSLFGGNSNWRGPIWFPVNYLIIESLQRFHHYYGDEFLVEHPVGSGQRVTLLAVADDLAERLTRLFLRDHEGTRPAMRLHPKLAADPHFRDHILFYEYFSGETGRGVGASHQTGWTGLVAKLLQPRGVTRVPDGAGSRA